MSKEEFEKKLEYTFKNSALLDQALQHPSLSKAKTISPFERLEFLGDRVLSLVIAQWLYALYPQETEGTLALRHSALVKRTTLLEVAKRLTLPTYLRRDQERGIPRLQEKIISDSCEALLGAVFLDGGFAVAQECIQNWWGPLVRAQITPPLNPKSLLQEWVQARQLPPPLYHVIGTSGPPHNPLFTIQLAIEGFPVIQASGPSKKMAETQAAENFLKHLQDSPQPQVN